MVSSPISDESLILRRLEEFDKYSLDFEESARSVAAELERRLKSAGIRVHSVSSRVKSRKSFESKLRRNPRRTILDVVGVRVITQYRDDVRDVEQLVRNALIVEEGTYVDKAEMLESDAFGYKSVQFVGRVPTLGYDSDHEDLSNRMFNGQWMGASANTVEVQLRSILEHAWASVDHDLVYKSDTPVSVPVQRLFALTAALLESADSHLDTIRTERSRPVLGVDENEPPELSASGYVQRFVETDRESIALDSKVTAALDLRRNYPEKYLREVISSVELAGWRSIKDLRASARDFGSLALRMSIACTDVRHSILLGDYAPYDKRPAESFPGIALYWLGIAIGAGRPTRYGLDPSIAIPKGRLAEYAEVARYLIANPDESALRVRDRYRSVAAPTGASVYPKIELS